MMKRIPWSTILFVLAVGAMLTQVLRSFAAGPPMAPRDKDVKSAERDAKPPKGESDERAPLPEAGLVGGNGVIEPADREVRIAAAVPALITAIKVKEGEHVQKDQVLVDLESSVEHAAVKAAEADVAAARATLDKTQRGQRSEERDAALNDWNAAKARAEQSQVQLTRTEQLVKGGAATQEELDKARLQAQADKASASAAEARYAQARDGSRSEDIAQARAALAGAEGRLDQARASLDRHTVRAPFSGEVLQIKSRVGEYYTPGQGDPLLVLGDTSKLRVRMDVDERDVARVKVGATGYATLDAFPNRRFPGKVVEIGRRMGRKNIRTDDPVERLDTKILEVVMLLDAPDGLVPGLRVVSFVKSE
jgi:multidrug resistance efflux pump